jgi:hypothetical protein
VPQETVILAAGQQRTERINGRFFTVISATAKFTVELDGRTRREVRAGSKIGGERFKRISFLETEGVTNTIIYDAGEDQYEGEIQVSGVSNETFPHAYWDDTDLTTINNGVSKTLPLTVTIGGVVYTRKSFTISNTNNADNILILNSSNKVLAVVQPNTDRTFDFEETVKAKASGGNIDAALYFSLYRTTPE